MPRWRSIRDALGLEVERAEEVASQRVRAHFIPGRSSLELLEATAPDSAIARYIDKRGPGLHHITLRVEDIDAALGHLEVARRPADRQRGAAGRGGRTRRVHPSLGRARRAGGAETAGAQGAAVHGRPSRHLLGDLELITLSDGFFSLDGGAMFGVVPRTLWEKRLPPDDRNRIPLGLRPLSSAANRP